MSDTTFRPEPAPDRIAESKKYLELIQEAYLTRSFKELIGERLESVRQLPAEELKALCDAIFAAPDDAGFSLLVESHLSRWRQKNEVDEEAMYSQFPGKAERAMVI